MSVSDGVKAVHSGLRNRKFRLWLEEQAKHPLKTHGTSGNACPHETMLSAGEQRFIAKLFSMYNEAEKLRNV